MQNLTMKAPKRTYIYIYIKAKHKQQNQASNQQQPVNKMKQNKPQNQPKPHTTFLEILVLFSSCRLLFVCSGCIKKKCCIKLWLPKTSCLARIFTRCIFPYVVMYTKESPLSKPAPLLECTAELCTSREITRLVLCSSWKAILQGGTKYPESCPEGDVILHVGPLPNPDRGAA